MLKFEEKTGVKFENYYQKYHPKLVRFLVSFSKDEDVAYDVATESFITSLERIDMYDPDKAVFSTWLFTIAKRLMIQKLREKSKFSSIESPTYDGISINDTLKTDMYDYEQDKEINDYKADIIKKLIPKLPKKYADVLTLRHFKNYSYQEISEELDVNLNTIKSRIRQARLLILKLTKNEFKYLDSLDDVTQVDLNCIKVVDLIEN